MSWMRVVLLLSLLALAASQERLLAMCPLALRDDTTLGRTVVIEESCKISGVPGVGAKLSCPPNEPAIIVRSGHLVMEHLELSGCSSGAVIVVECSGCKVSLNRLRFTNNSVDHLLVARHNVVVNESSLINTVNKLQLTGFDLNSTLREVPDISGGQLMDVELRDIVIADNRVKSGLFTVSGGAFRVQDSEIFNNTGITVNATLFSTNHSSVYFDQVNIMGNKAWANVFDVQRPLGTSVFNKTFIRENDCDVLMRFLPRQVFTNISLHRSTTDWLYGPNVPYGGKEIEGNDEEMMAIRDQMREEYMKNYTRSEEGLRQMYWSAPVFFLDSMIELNHLTQALVNSTGSPLDGSMMVWENTTITNNTVGGTEVKQNMTTSQAAMFEMRHAEMWFRRQVNIRNNRVYGDMFHLSAMRFMIWDTSLSQNVMISLPAWSPHRGRLLRMQDATVNVLRAIFADNQLTHALIDVRNVNFTMNDTQIIGNVITTPQLQSLVYVNNSRPTFLFGCRFHNNTVPRGAVVDMNYAHFPYPYYNNFTHNIGSPLYISLPFYFYEKEVLGVKHSLFAHNRLTVVRDRPQRMTSAALAMYMRAASLVEVYNLTFLNNTPVNLNPEPQQRGGAMLVTYEGDLIWTPDVMVREVRFINNKSPGSGGGLAAGRAVTVKDCTFLNNEATQQGGGVYAEGAYLNVTNVLFRHNRAQAGGAVAANPQNHPCENRNLAMCAGAWVHIANSVMEGNIAQGQKLQVSTLGTVRWDADLMACAPGGGGAVCVHPSNFLTLTGVKLVNNVAKWGGGVFLHDSCPLNVTSQAGLDRQPRRKCPKDPNHRYHFTLVNSTLVNNTAAQNGTGAAVFATSTSRLRVCCGLECDQELVGQPEACATWYLGQGEGAGVHDPVGQSPPLPDKTNQSTTLPGEAIRTPSDPPVVPAGSQPEAKTHRLSPLCGMDSHPFCGVLGTPPAKIEIIALNSSYPNGSSLPDKITLNYMVTLYDDYGFRLETTPSSTNIQLVVQQASHTSNSDSAIMEYVDRLYTGSNLSLSIRLVSSSPEELPIDVVIQGLDQVLQLPQPLQFGERKVVRPCKLGEGREGEGCLICPQGLFSGFPTMRCEPCPPNGACNSSQGVLVPQEGYWHSSPYSPMVLTCPLIGSCRRDNRTRLLQSYVSDQSQLLAKLSDPEFDHLAIQQVLIQYGELQCAEGYSGNACSGCADGYGRVGYRCMRCPPLWRNILYCILVFLALCVQVVLVLVNHVRSVNQKLHCPRVGQIFRASSSMQQLGYGSAQLRGAILKMLLTYVQMLFVAPKLRVSWPPSLRKFLEVSSLTAPTEWISLECLAGGSVSNREIWRTVLVVTSPVGLALLALGVWGAIWISQYVHDAVRKRRTWSWNLPPLLSAWDYINPRMIATIIQICFVLYPMVTSTVMEIFPCDTLDTTEGSSLFKDYVDKLPAINGTTIWQGVAPGGGSPTKYWTRNLNIKCERGHAQHTLKQFVGLPAAVIFVIGFPVGCAAIVMRQTFTKRLQDPDVALKYGFLYDTYQEKYSFWELIILLRKGVLLAASIFLAPYGPNIQLPSCIMVLVLSIIGQEVFRPFGLPLLNRLERDSLLAVLLNFIMLCYFASDNLSEEVQMVLFVLVVVITLAVFLELLYHFLYHVLKIAVGWVTSWWQGRRRATGGPKMPQTLPKRSPGIVRQLPAPRLEM